MIPINLLPWREQKRQALKKDYFYRLIMVALVAMLLLLLVRLFFQSVINAQENRNSYLKAQTDILKPQTKIYDALIKAEKDNLTKIDVLDKLNKQRDDAPKILAILVSAMPTGAYLLNISFTPTTMTLIGVTNSSKEITEFMNALGKVTLFRDAKISDLITSSQNGNVRQQFKITLTIVPEPIVAPTPLKPIAPTTAISTITAAAALSVSAPQKK